MKVTKSCPLCGCLLNKIIIVEESNLTEEKAEGSFYCSYCETEFIVKGKSAEDIYDKWNKKFYKVTSK